MLVHNTAITASSAPSHVVNTYNLVGQLRDLCLFVVGLRRDKSQILLVARPVAGLILCRVAQPRASQCDRAAKPRPLRCTGIPRSVPRKDPPTGQAALWIIVGWLRYQPLPVARAAADHSQWVDHLHRRVQTFPSVKSQTHARLLVNHGFRGPRRTTSRSSFTVARRDIL